MSVWLRNHWALAAFSLWVPCIAQAIPIAVTFTATGFVPLVGGDSAPVDPVSGVIVYEAASTDAPIESLVSISLTIAAHTYNLSEIGFVSESGIAYVGGLIDGVRGSGNFEDDFWIIWDQAALLPMDFLYATVDGAGGPWDTQTFREFSVTATAPEGNTLALLTLGVLGMVAARRRELLSRSVRSFG